MNEQLELFKKFTKKIIINPYFIVITVFTILMYFLMSPVNTGTHKEQKKEIKINSLDKMIKNQEKPLSDEEEENMLLGISEKKESTLPETKTQEKKIDKKTETVTQEYANKIYNILSSTKKETVQPTYKKDIKKEYQNNIYSDAVLKKVHSMLQNKDKGIVNYINETLRGSNIVGDRNQIIRIRGEIPVVCETAKLLCEEKIVEPVPYARCITLYKNCLNPKEFQEISIEEFRLYRK